MTDRESTLAIPSITRLLYLKQRQHWTQLRNGTSAILASHRKREALARKHVAADSSLTLRVTKSKGFTPKWHVQRTDGPPLPTPHFRGQSSGAFVRLAGHPGTCLKTQPSEGCLTWRLPKRTLYVWGTEPFDCLSSRRAPLPAWLAGSKLSSWHEPYFSHPPLSSPLRRPRQGVGRREVTVKPAFLAAKLIHLPDKPGRGHKIGTQERQSGAVQVVSHARTGSR